MRVIDLTNEHRDLFAQCLMDWSDDAKEAGPRRKEWVERFLGRGLRAKLALDDQGVVGGMIQYLPIEASSARGTGLYFIPCIWVHGHKQGRGDFRGHGMGSALLAAAEADARALGAKGMAAWGIWLPVWMKASWFKRHGYRKADRRGLAVLLWKPFTEDAQPPHWLSDPKPLPASVPGKVTVTTFVNGWCLACDLSCERAKRAAAEFGDRVVLREIDVSEPGALDEWRRSDEIFVDGKQVRTGPPPSYAKLRGLLAKKVRRLS